MAEMHSPNQAFASTNAGFSAMVALIEVLLIVGLLFVLVGTPPPDVNEAHYLAKAKHYWNPGWCARDSFLSSADAHWTFYWTFGWVTRFVSLETSAWIGRFATWTLLAWGWQRLSSTIMPGRGVSVLSAGLFAALVQWFPMAGEWVFGGVEAKGFAYALLLFSLRALAINHWRQAVLLSGAAAAFHVLVGGWALVAQGFAWLLTDPTHRTPLRRLWPALALACVAAMPGVLPGLALNGLASPENVAESNRIYVFERLAHHLVFHRLSHLAIGLHVTGMACFLLAWKWHQSLPTANGFRGPLPRFIVGTFLIALMGAILDQTLLYATPWAASLLRFYWFRLSDMMVPLGLTWVLVAWQQRVLFQWRGAGKWMWAGLCLVTIANLVNARYQQWSDPRPRAVAQAFPGIGLSTAERVRRWQEWRRVCLWIATHTAKDDLFLTPRSQQTFKWDAERAEVVNRKDFPQDADAIVAWRQRMNDVFPAAVRYSDLVAHGEQRLRELAQNYGVQYIVVDRSFSPAKLSFPRVFPESADELTSDFEVYRVP